MLVITRNLPPLCGGMERLNLHLVRELTQAFEVSVCGPEGCAKMLPDVATVAETPLRPLSRFLVQNALCALRLARRIRPQLVLAGSGLTVPAALAVGRACNAPVAAYLHGLDIVADHPLYRLIWRRSLRYLDAAFVNSRHTRALAVAAGVAETKLRVLHPGVRIPAPNPDAALTFRRDFGLGERPLILSVGRLTARKGLAEFIAAVMPELVRAHPELMLIVIGGEARDALGEAGGGQRERIMKVAGTAGVESSVRLLGVQDDAVVTSAMWASSALVFPVLDLPGDVEGFGMVAMEAAAHGLPTVAFAVGGVSDAVSDPTSGRLLAAGDYPAMTAALSGCVNAARDAGAVAARVAYAENFGWPAFGRKLRACCTEIIAEE
jgi:phosphatidylinositol alpha-1,6-mannosyltransferase